MKKDIVIGFAKSQNLKNSSTKGTKVFRPKEFNMDDPEIIQQFLERNSFGILVSSQSGRIVATHIPFTFEFDSTLKKMIFHVARPNEQSALADGTEILAIFSGPHAYVTNRYYEEKNTAPTWNYESVHVYGKITRLDKIEDVRQGLMLLVDINDKANASLIAEIEQGKFDKMSQGLQMFSADVERVEAAWKLSQHHPVERTKKVVKRLRKEANSSSIEIASEMQKFSIDKRKDV